MHRKRMEAACERNASLIVLFALRSPVASPTTRPNALPAATAGPGFPRPEGEQVATQVSSPTVPPAVSASVIMSRSLPCQE